MSQQQYAISEYLNVDEVYARLDKLISQPIRPVRREKMQAYLDYFEAKCRRSKELNDEACQIIPGEVNIIWLSTIHFRLLLKKRMALIYGMWMETVILIFSKRAAQPCWGATMLLSVKKSLRC